MSSEKDIKNNIRDRLTMIVDELCGGNGKKFAEGAGIKQATFHNYMKGRLPSAEVLNNICNTYRVNLNWLVSGIGEKYIDIPSKKLECRFLEKVDRWISDLKKEEPESEAWFKVQFKNLFPEFRKWTQGKNKAEGTGTEKEDILGREVHEPVN